MRRPQRENGIEFSEVSLGLAVSVVFKGFLMNTLKKLASVVLLTLSLLLLTSTEVSAITKVKKRAGGPPNGAELKKAERRLSEMGYSTSRLNGVIDRTALITFQKWEGRKVTGRLTRDDLEAILHTERSLQDLWQDVWMEKITSRTALLPQLL